MANFWVDKIANINFKEGRLWKSLFLSNQGDQGIGELPDYKFLQRLLQPVQQFCDCFIVRELGDGKNIKFWNHNWSEGILRYEFPTLYIEAGAELEILNRGAKL